MDPRSGNSGKDDNSQSDSPDSQPMETPPRTSSGTTSIQKRNTLKDFGIVVKGKQASKRKRNSDNPQENRKAGIWIGVMVPFIALTLFGSSCGVIVYKKRNQRNRKGPSVSNELYARLDGVSYYDNFQIKILNNGNPVGEGQFGQVFKGIFEKQASSDGHSMNVAIKQVEDVALMQREAKIMAPLDHQNVVKLIGVCQDLLEYPCLIFEWMDQDSLLSLLKAKPLEPVQQKDIAVQVCRGLKYISDFGCVHRDIAARNVLINSPGCYKLADFGLSREIPVDKDYYRMISGGILPVKWMAPECLQRSPAALFSTKSDIWSFGVLLYEVLTSGSDPYPGLSAEEAINSIRRGGTPAIPSCYAIETQLLLQRCWVHEPDKRPSPSLLQELLDRWDTKTFQRPGIVGYVFSASQVHTVNRTEQEQQQPYVAIHRIENGITAAFLQRL